MILSGVLLALALPALAAEPLQSLTVALYHDEKTRASVRFLMDYYKNEAPFQVRPEVDSPGRFLSACGGAVTRPFGAMVSVERADDAARSGADLSAVLSAGAGLPRDMRFEKRARVSLRAEFQDLSGKSIARLEAESLKAPVADARVRVRKDLYRELEAAWSEAAALLEAKVRASPELAAYAAGRAGARPAPQAVRAAVSSEVDRASYRLPVEPSAVALVVGGEARFAEGDAAAVRSQLIGLGWPDRSVLWLTGPRAERSEVRQALETLKRRGAGAARACVYFSGGSSTDAKGRTELRLRDGSLALDDLLDALSSLGAGHALAVLDAPAAPGPARPGLAVMTGAGPGEERGVDDGEGHGRFTLDFLKALTGAADKKGRVTARGAFEAAAARVRAAAGGKQNPSWTAPEGFDPVLVEGSSRAR